MDDLEVPLFQETSKFLYSWFDRYPRILAIQSTATAYYIVSVIDDMFHHILSNIQWKTTMFSYILMSCYYVSAFSPLKKKKKHYLIKMV